jgi:hypothetical protein
MTSCATTTLTSVWKDGQFRSGSIKKAIVIGVSQKPAIRRLFEDEFARQLKTRGIEAIPGYTISQSDQIPDKDSILSKVKELQADAVLITRLIDKKAIETYYPPQRTRSVSQIPPPYVSGSTPPEQYWVWYNYYNQCYQCEDTPGYRVQNELVSLETNIYDAKTDKLIWSALSDTFLETLDSGINARTIKSFIRVIMKRLTVDGVI